MLQMFATFVAICLLGSQVESSPFRANIDIKGLEDGDIKGTLSMKDVLQYFVTNLKGKLKIPENAENIAKVLRNLSIKPLPSNIKFRGSGSVEMSEFFVILSDWVAKLFKIPKETMIRIREKIATASQNGHTEEHDTSYEYEDKFRDQTRKKPPNNIVVRVQAPET